MLGWEENVQGTCFGHTTKACQYATTKEKASKDLRYMSIKSAQGDLQKCIIWPKIWKGQAKMGKGMCKFKSQKLNTLVKTS